MPEHILLIEDDAAIRDFICELLSEEGYPIQAVPDGRAALSYLHAAEILPALVLLDLSMPVMDGAAFRAAQQAISHLAAIPVVLLSAASDLERSAAALNIPAYLKKPIDYADLLDVVVRYCEQARTR